MRAVPYICQADLVRNFSVLAVVAVLQESLQPGIWWLWQAVFSSGDPGDTTRQFLQLELLPSARAGQPGEVNKVPPPLFSPTTGSHGLPQQHSNSPTAPAFGFAVSCQKVNAGDVSIKIPVFLPQILDARYSQDSMGNVDHARVNHCIFTISQLLL